MKDQTSIITLLTIFCCFVILVVCKEVRSQMETHVWVEPYGTMQGRFYANARKPQKDEKYDCDKAFQGMPAVSVGQ